MHRHTKHRHSSIQCMEALQNKIFALASALAITMSGQMAGVLHPHWICFTDWLNYWTACYYSCDSMHIWCDFAIGRAVAPVVGDGPLTSTDMHNIIIHL